MCVVKPLSDTLGPDIFGHFLLQYRGFPVLEVKNVLVAPVGAIIFVLILTVFFLIRRVILENFHCII